MSSLRLIPFVLAVLGSCQSFAWLGKGHEQIADIAWLQLSEAAKKEIGEILMAGDKEFVPLSTKESDVRAAFRKAATWADWIKENKVSKFEPNILAWNAKYQPGYDANDKDREAHRCKRWHYFDIPINFSGDKPGVEGSNALIALTTARYELATLGRQTPKDRATQCWWLYWMEHVIGDLHQPLHCVSSYAFDARGDAGGNFFKLGIPIADNPSKMTNLHFYWDAGIENAIQMDSSDKKDVESVSERWTKDYAPFHNDASNLDFEKWIAKGAEDAKNFVYEGIERDGKPSQQYLERQAKYCRNQAVLAGFRLAKEISVGLGMGESR